MKPFAVTPPPAGSSFLLDRDATGRLRVSWYLPEKGGFGHWTDLGCSFVLMVFLVVAVLAPGIGMFMDGKNPLGFVACCGVAVLPIIGMLPRLLLVFRSSQPAMVIFGPTELLHAPGRTWTYREKGLLADWRTLLRGDPPPRVFRLHQIGQVRVDQLGARQRLSIDVGSERIEIGSSLKEPEREWLARQVTEWSKQIPNVLPAEREPPSTDFQARPPR